MAGEHPHDCPPECRRCEREEAWQRIREELACDEPVVDAEGVWRPCWACARREGWLA